jgi:hypothetical protein
MIAEETFNQNNLLCSLFSFSTKSGKVSFIFSTGNCSPITPVEANIRSLIFTVSEVPFSDLESLKVKILDRFFAKISKLSFPCFPVKVLAFFVFTNKPLMLFL